MQPSRTLPPFFSLVVLAAFPLALLSGCAEWKMEPEGASAPGEEALPGEGGGLAADGAPPPWNGEGDPPWAGDEPGVPDSSIHLSRGRIELTITATGSLLPNAGVALSIKGEALDAIDSGEVVLTLPTRALMDYAGAGLPDLPVKARWDLPAMAKGDTWSGTYTVPGEPAGYYRVMANATTHGPGGGLFLYDGVVQSAWMFVSATNGQLTRWFEDSLFPDSVHPRAGPVAADGVMSFDRITNRGHRDSVYLHVLYTINPTAPNGGFKPAVGARIWGSWNLGPDGSDYRKVTVPQDGIVAFGCRLPTGAHWGGGGDVPDTYFVEGRSDITSWTASERHCGKVLSVEVLAHKYLPWRLLGRSAITLQNHFGHRRGRVDWNLASWWNNTSYYNPATDNIILKWGTDNERYLHWTAGHEYGHALHHKALGGMWWKPIRPSVWSCYSHTIDKLESYRCALQEGFANYAGTIASGYREQCFEHLGTPRAHDIKGNWCRDISHDQKPRSEAWVAAFFLDLTDADTGERKDETAYPGRYVAEVFKTCHVQNKYNMPWPIPDVYIWWKRSNVSNIVWCLEEAIEPVFHEDGKVFEDIRAPVKVKWEGFSKPLDWDRWDIRDVWTLNLRSGWR